MAEAQVSLDSVSAKLRRADEHAKALTGELASFVNLYSHAVEVDHNADFTEYYASIHFDGGDPDYVGWGLLLGDYVHCLRSALDHLIYAFAVAESNAEPPPDANKVMMPLKTTEQGFRDAGYRIAGLNDVVRARIETLQPYPDRPDNALLGVLDDMDIRDKHRILPVLAFRPAEAAAQISGGIPGQKTRIKASGEPLKDGAPFLTVSFDRPSPDVQVDGNLALSILVPDAEPVSIGWYVAGELVRALRLDVRRAIQILLGEQAEPRPPLKLMIGHQLSASGGDEP